MVGNFVAIFDLFILNLFQKDVFLLESFNIFHITISFQRPDQLRGYIRKKTNAAIFIEKYM